MPKRLRVRTAATAPSPASTRAHASASRKYWAQPSTFVYPMEDEYACRSPKGTSHHPESKSPIATVEPAHHSVRVRGTGAAASSLRQIRKAASVIPQRVGSSSTIVRMTAPPSAYIPGTMCDSTHPANTTAAQPRYLPSRTAQAKRPRNNTARERLNE